MDISPTFKGYIEDENDALLILQATLDGKLQQIPRRPYEIERPYLIVSGSIFVFVEEISGIKRWTDGISWSPSRITGKFLVYRELDKGSGHGHSNDLEISSTSMRYSGLVKKTISVKLKRAPFHLLENFHIVSYYTIDDVKGKRIMSPKNLVFFNDVVPSQELIQAMENTTLGNVKTSTSGSSSSHKLTPMSANETLSTAPMMNVQQLQPSGSVLAINTPVSNMGSHYFVTSNGQPSLNTGSATFQNLVPNSYQHNNINSTCNNSNDKNNFSVRNSNIGSAGTISVDQNMPGLPNTNYSYYYTYVPTNAQQNQSTSSSPQPMMIKTSGTIHNGNTMIDHIQHSNSGSKVNSKHNTGNSISSGGNLNSIPPINSSYYYQHPTNQGNSRTTSVAFTGGISNPQHHESSSSSASGNQLPGIHTQASSNVLPYFQGSNIGNPQAFSSMPRNFTPSEGSLNQTSINNYQNYQLVGGAPTNSSILNTNNSGNTLTTQSSNNIIQQHQAQPASISYSQSYTQPPSMYQQYYSTNQQQAFNTGMDKGLSKLGSSTNMKQQVQSQNNPQGLSSGLAGTSNSQTPGSIPFIPPPGSSHSSSIMPVPSTAATTPATISSVKTPSSSGPYPIMPLDRPYHFQNSNTQTGSALDNNRYNP